MIPSTMSTSRGTVRPGPVIINPFFSSNPFLIGTKKDNSTSCLGIRYKVIGKRLFLAHEHSVMPDLIGHL